MAEKSDNNEEIRQNIHATPETAEAVYIAPSAVISGRVRLGKDASVWHGAVLRGDMAPILAGARTNIQDGAILHVAHDHPCILGDDVTVGHGAIVHACTIGNACLIGMGAIILNGTTIGDECIVAAGSIIPGGKNIPPRSLVMGSPAKVIRSLSEDEIAHLYDQAQSYVRVARETALFEASGSTSTTTAR